MDFSSKICATRRKLGYLSLMDADAFDLATSDGSCDGAMFPVLFAV